MPRVSGPLESVSGPLESVSGPLESVSGGNGLTKLGHALERLLSSNWTLYAAADVDRPGTQLTNGGANGLRIEPTSQNPVPSGSSREATPVELRAGATQLTGNGGIKQPSAGIGKLPLRRPLIEGRGIDRLQVGEAELSAELRRLRAVKLQQIGIEGTTRLDHGLFIRIGKEQHETAGTSGQASQFGRLRESPLPRAPGYHVEADGRHP